MTTALKILTLSCREIWKDSMAFPQSMKGSLREIYRSVFCLLCYSGVGGMLCATSKYTRQYACH